MDRLQIALERARAEREKLLAGAAPAAGNTAINTAFSPVSLVRPLPVPLTAVPTLNAAPAPAAAALPALPALPAQPAVPPPHDDTFVGLQTVATNVQSLVQRGFGGGHGPLIDASYKMLRTRVLQKMQQYNWNTLAIVSPTPNDGKTFTAINLALAIASDTKHTTLLVDFDLRKPSIHRHFGFQPSIGVEDCLRGKADIAAALVVPAGFNKLVLLPARKAQSSSSELLTSDQAARLVKELKARYPNRIVIFDLPPVLGADDALAFAPLVDCGLMVIGAGRTRRDDVSRSLEVLHSLPIIGTVLNGSRTEHSSGYVY
jgi:Mrp family chromosome partitioning ATPase